ncbi:MAG: nitrous oxide reductase family maturation protein NosD [Promethearchaeota archaeon]
MMSKRERLITLLIIGLLIPSLINKNINFKDNHNIIKTEIKSSGEYTESFIHIDGSMPGNWTATTSYDWCSGDGSWSNPYVIENVTIDASNSPTEYGIFIEKSNVFFIIQNCHVYNSVNYGILLVEVNNSRLINNNCSNNDYGGISVQTECSNNTIQENIANENGQYGIYFYEECINNTVSRNIVKYNVDTGISLHWYINNSIINENIVNNNGIHGIEVIDWCGFNTISNNIVKDNEEDGIDFQYNCKNNTVSDNIINNNDLYGIYVYSYCDDNILLENTLTNNSEGLRLDSDCDYNIITGNTISDNIQYGIYSFGGVEDSYNDYNKINDNVLFKNNIGIHLNPTSNNSTLSNNFFVRNLKHATDDGTDNKWNCTTIGNYWDNHTSPDANNDGIVDEIYTYIGGSMGSIDYLPIAEDGEPQIIINSPSEGDAFRLVAPNYNVTITDDYLDTMWYTLDGGLHNFTFTDNGKINQSAWEGIDDDNITLSFYARDIPRNIGYAEVNIIKDTTAPIIIINSPEEGDKFGKNSPLFNITVLDDNIELVWYSFDEGLTNYDITNNIFSNQTAWSELDEGEITVMFYARDIVGNEVTESVTIFKSIPSGLEPGIIAIIVVISIIGGIALIGAVYILMKKRGTT